MKGIGKKKYIVSRAHIHTLVQNVKTNQFISLTYKAKEGMKYWRILFHFLFRAHSFIVEFFPRELMEKRVKRLELWLEIRRKNGHYFNTIYFYFRH